MEEKTRTEVYYETNTPRGRVRVTALSSMSADDVLRVMTKLHIVALRGGPEYASPLSREIRLLITGASDLPRSA